MTSTMGTQADANAIVTQSLADYGLQGLSQWAWNEITSGSSPTQVLMDMQQTPQFKARFPGIEARQKAGLPAISPADYVGFEDQMKQLENRFSLPTGFLSDPAHIANWIGKDVSSAELTTRVQNGYAAVAYSPPAVRQAYTQMFGANGDGALAAQFLDVNKATELLTQQATAAQISGNFAMGGVNMDTQHAMTLAQQGQTQQSVGTSLAHLQQQASLYNSQVGETGNLTIGGTGVEAEFGTNQTATQEVLQREQQRQAAFQGGGQAYQDAQGASGIGAARPL